MVFILNYPFSISWKTEKPALTLIRVHTRILTFRNICSCYEIKVEKSFAFASFTLYQEENKIVEFYLFNLIGKKGET